MFTVCLVWAVFLIKGCPPPPAFGELGERAPNDILAGVRGVIALTAVDTRDAVRRIDWPTFHWRCFARKKRADSVTVFKLIPERP